MSIPQIVTLLEFCLKNTCFLLQGKYYEQVHDAAMSSPINPFKLPTCSWKRVKVKALNSAPHPHVWTKVCG